MRRFIAAAVTFLLAISIDASPRSDYMIHCMGCHMMDGRGMPPEVPAFDKTLGELVSKPGGRAYLIRVPGASQSPLDDESLARVLNWVLEQYAVDALPEDFVAFSPAEVARFRPMPLATPEVMREKLLNK